MAKQKIKLHALDMEHGDGIFLICDFARLGFSVKATKVRNRWSIKAEREIKRDSDLNSDCGVIDDVRERRAKMVIDDMGF